MLPDAFLDVCAYARSLGILEPNREALLMYNRNLFELPDSFALQAKADFYALARQWAVARIADLSLKLVYLREPIPALTGAESFDELRAIERELRGRLQRETGVTSHA